VKWVRIVVTLVALAAVATATKPRLAFDVAQAAMLEQGGDAARGRLVFDAGDRASCHASPRQPDWLRLGGGLALDSPFGIVFPPNISPDPNDGIGRWRTIDLANALMSGVSSDGRHFYPAYLRTLPPSQGERRNTTCRFPSRSHAVQHRSGARSGMELGALLVDAVARCASRMRAFDAAERQLEAFKGRVRSDTTLPSASGLSGQVTLIEPGADHGFILNNVGSQLYFPRDSVTSTEIRGSEAGRR
jgi:hypothetical protein